MYVGGELGVQTWPIKNNVQQFSGPHCTQRAEQYTDRIDTDSIKPIDQGRRLEFPPSAFTLLSQRLPGIERNKLSAEPKHLRYYEINFSQKNKIQSF